MRAAVMYAAGDIRVGELPKPVAGSDEVLLKVAACGVCGSDIPRMLTRARTACRSSAGTSFRPCRELGGDVEGYPLGKLVSVAPLIPCRRCDQCLTGNFSRCRDYDYFGSRRDGAYDEDVLVPRGNLLKTPSGIDPRAAVMTDPASIALHAIWKHAVFPRNLAREISL